METKTKHECIKETEIAIINNNFQYMVKEVGEIKCILKDFITTAENKFASKEALEKQKTDIEKLKQENLDFKLLIAKWMWIWYILTMIIWFIINKLF